DEGESEPGEDKGHDKFDQQGVTRVAHYITSAFYGFTDSYYLSRKDIYAPAEPRVHIDFSREFVYNSKMENAGEWLNW
ncbi:MAG: hypothetical protein AB1374_13215, partial [Bacillota bacterium]